MNFFLAPVLAAIAAVTVSAKTDVPINRVYVPIVVFGTPEWHLQDNHVSDFRARDVSDAQIAAAESRIADAGIDRQKIQAWTQSASVLALHPGDKNSVRIGIILVDLGSPAEANANSLVLTKIQAPNLAFGWNAAVGVDCAAMQRQITERLQALAHDAAKRYGGGAAAAKIISLTKTATDPRTGAFDPIPLCPADGHPLIVSAGGKPQTRFQDRFTSYASASVELSYDPATEIAAPTPETQSFFPFSTFGFASPIIGQQNRGYVLRGGRFAATPGASSIGVPVDAALVHFTFEDAAHYASAVRSLQQWGIASSDYAADRTANDLYVRLRPAGPERWSAIASLGGSAQSYRLIADCKPFQAYARAVALRRSRNLAQAAARVLHVALGSLDVETDWAGASNDATCGTDGSGDLASLIAFAKSNGRASTGDPSSAYFWDSIYAAWTLGSRAPKVASQSIVDRLAAVIRSDKTGEDVTGTATITPDAYFYTGRTSSDFTTTIVASKADAPKDEALGNVVTDCDRAQERAIANAVRVALFDGPVNSFYAAPADFLSIGCMPSDVIGHTYSSFPTVYNESSPTGAAQVTQTITVYP